VELLNGEYARPLRLAMIARRVGCSPFHLSQIFSRETGMSMHRHLSQLRLRAALGRLAAGERDLTRLALDVGFASRSHFAGAFSSAFGAPPSRVRADFARIRTRPPRCLP
jgi:AraC-like DNA-binding protein